MPRSVRRGAPRRPTGAAHAAAAYLRRSTDRQEQSIPDQLRAIQRHCAERGLELVRTYTDDAVSGARATNRPAFQRMIADAQRQSCGFAFVVVYDVKRFGRLGNDEAGHYRHLLRTAGVEVLYACEGFSGGESDDLLRPVKQWQARQESKDLSKVTIRGLLTRAGGGWWMGGAPPFGYDLRYESERGEFLCVVRFLADARKQTLDAKGRVARTLERGETLSISQRDRARLTPGAPERVAAVRRIFEMYTQEGRGLAAIADALNAAGVATPRGPEWSRIYSGKWRDSTVRSILVNPLYTGDMVWNRRTDARFHKIEGGRAVERREAHGARLVPNDREDWIVVPDAHEALVPRRTWELAQTARRARAEAGAAAEDEGRAARPVGGWSGARARFLLSGLARCGRCGGRLQGVTRTKGKRSKDGGAVKTRSYGCGSYIARGRSGCAALGGAPQERLESAVVEAVIAHYTRRYQGGEGMRALAEAVRARLGGEARDLAAARARLDTDRAKVDATIARLLDNLSEATRDLAEERLTQLRGQRERLRARAEELERLALAEAEALQLTQELGALVASLPYTLLEAPNEARKAALRRCVERVTVSADGRSATLTLRALPLTQGGFGEQEQQSDEDVEEIELALACAVRTRVDTGSGIALA